MNGLEAVVAIVGIIGAVIAICVVMYAFGRDMKFFKGPECLGVMGRLRGHKYTAWNLAYVQSNCFRCGKHRGA